MTTLPVNAPGVIRVMAGIQPLIMTSDATVIEFYDGFGDLMALFCRHFNDDMWIFVTKADADWQDHLIRLGYLDAPMSAEQLVRSLASKG